MSTNDQTPPWVVAANAIYDAVQNDEPSINWPAIIKNACVAHADAETKALQADRDDWKQRYETRCKAAALDEAEAITEATAAVHSELAEAERMQEFYEKGMDETSKERDALRNQLDTANSIEASLSAKLKAARVVLRRLWNLTPETTVELANAVDAALNDAPAGGPTVCLSCDGHGWLLNADNTTSTPCPSCGATGKGDVVAGDTGKEGGAR